MSETLEREAMEYDVVIVGAGPSGLAAAIRLKQMAEAAGAEISVAVLEKGSEVGAHILSGAVIDPSGIAELLPDWKELGVPLETAVTQDKFLMLGPAGELDVSWAPFPKWIESRRDRGRWRRGSPLRQPRRTHPRRCDARPGHRRSRPRGRSPAPAATWRLSPPRSRPLRGARSALKGRRAGRCSPGGRRTPRWW